MFGKGTRQLFAQSSEQYRLRRRKGLLSAYARRRHLVPYGARQFDGFVLEESLPATNGLLQTDVRHDEQALEELLVDRAVVPSDNRCGVRLLEIRVLGALQID